MGIGTPSAGDDGALISKLNASMDIADQAFHDAVVVTSALYGAKIWPRRDRFDAIYLGFVDACAELHRSHIGKTRLAFRNYLVAEYREDGAGMFANMMKMSDDQGYLEWRKLGRQAMLEVMNGDDTGVAIMKLAKAYLS